MPDTPIFDLYEEYPKAVIDGPRRAIVAALEESYFLTDLLFELLDSAMAKCAEGHALIEDLTARVAALEAAVPPTDPPQEVSP